MSANLFPAPVGTPIINQAVSKTGFAPAWDRYFKVIGDDLLEANNVRNLTGNSAFKYTLNGNHCDCTYWIPADASVDAAISLPFTALLAFDVNGTVYPAGTKSITIPKTTHYAHFWFTVLPAKS
jgi:hypothetical protein